MGQWQSSEVPARTPTSPSFGTEQDAITIGVVPKGDARGGATLLGGENTDRRHSMRSWFGLFILALS